MPPTRLQVSPKALKVLKMAFLAHTVLVPQSVLVCNKTAVTFIQPYKLEFLFLPAGRRISFSGGFDISNFGMTDNQRNCF
jgi:hypothetical protein